VPEFHALAPQATVSEGLAQGPYVAAIERESDERRRLSQCATHAHADHTQVDTVKFSFE